nr:MAG TPA: hypothetical protein [Caudoviricetes sp.]DAN32480.1 MAG TPA: hypothetical protein [Caudoviricetes sp.]
MNRRSHRSQETCQNRIRLSFCCRGDVRSPENGSPCAFGQADPAPTVDYLTTSNY